ncbi:transglycosylase domain-containing protein [Salinibacterium sp. G-O1]|uniref:transglycosylase domain-containing protein n=1 Tax=Salinibacterium sp. G-O1 TaxID=3046208 RepID=UPI0024B8AAEB|nr:transglycosylase domain-containing protein [Salinibacterium sp. G-O1]MDJ0334251.1 transglycosylase domain-containing protein [Salinibacterium sp. G-O1]
MSAQNPPRRGVVSGIAGLLGFSVLSGILVTVMVAPAIAVTGVTASSTIGVFDSLPEYINIGQQSQRNEIYATYTGEGNVNGTTLIATIYDQNREEVGYDEISKFALDATVDGEDARFFEHGGVDVSSVVRAALANLSSGQVESGASTLSMQLVKNIGTAEAENLPTQEERDAAYEKSKEESFDRKLKEMKQAIGLEKKYTKKEILTAYLNIANFGNATYGIQAASQRYYSINASDLNIAQAASLVAIVQYPNVRNLGDPENFQANKDRRDYIINSMYGAGNITAAERDEAIATPVDETTINPKPAVNGCIAANDYAKFFCDYVVKSVGDFEFLGNNAAERNANWKVGGYKLYTTLDLDVQIPAQNATWTYAPNTETGFELGSATSTVQPNTGRVLVMTQNKLFDDTAEGAGSIATAVNFNTSYEYGGSSGFQPGSTYKVFTLLDWLKAGNGVEERVSGSPNSREPFSSYTACGDKLSGGTFSFKNNAGEAGTYTVRNGTVNSVNGVFFSMAKQLDLCDIRDVAASLGVERADGDPLETNPTSIIGTNTVTPLSMAAAYAAIAANGLYCKPIIVDKVTMPDGTSVTGQTPDCRQAISANIADTAIDVLKGVMVTGNQVYSNPDDGIPIFGKTGTTDSANHTWMATGTSTAGTVVWVGNIFGDYDILDSGYAGVSGIRLRHYIMNPTVSALNAKYGGADWPAPDPELMTGGGQTVPPVAGLTASAARTILEGLGFSYADGGAIDSDVEAGRVVGTDPSVGTISAKGVTITVYTSKGNKIPFPDVVGDGKSNDFNDAKSQVQAAGYSSVSQQCVVLAPSSGPGPVLPSDPRVGKVQSSDPAAGAPTVPGTPVTLGVGKVSCP